MTDPLLPPIPEPGDQHIHDATDDENVALLRSFMITAATVAPAEADSPAVPSVVFDLVLVDAFVPEAGAVALRIIVEHSDKSSRAVLGALQRAMAMLDSLAEPRS